MPLLTICFNAIDKSFLIKLIKFGIIGFSGVFIDFGITYFLKERIRLHKYISNSIGFLTAASTNYILNRIWTFQSNNPKIMLEYSKFVVIAIIGLGINNFVIWLLSDKVLRINFYISKTLATVVVFFWNFLMNYFFNFN